MRAVRGAAMAAILAASLAAPAGQAPATAAAETLESFELVGHDPLGNRGMNAALAVHGDHAYVGSRTDGKPWGTDLNLNGAGILVVDVSDPASPQVVHEIGPPDQGVEDQTSREMRVWPQQDLLIVQNLASNCSELIHMCSPRGSLRSDVFTFYDISGDKAAAPEKILEFDPPDNPHEFFLWVDPFDPDRALMYVGPAAANNRRIQVYDISPVLRGDQPVRVANATTGVPAGGLHSLSVNNDGTRAYLAHLTGGFVVFDTSDLANGVTPPELRPLTPPAQRPTWPGPGAHSAVKLYGREVALVTDEVYGDALTPIQPEPHGCPWGWTRVIDIEDPAAPEVVGEYRMPQNEPEFCESDQPRPFSSWSAHNPTITSDLAFISWHAGGLQAISVDDPAAPTRAGQFVPDPLPAVLQEDPVLSTGQDKVVMWSYPVIAGGLIYVVDVRNGLYILRYTGAGADDIAEVEFLEGNSNLGDALRYEPPDPCIRVPPPPGAECEPEI
jgi:hypothetical protein